MKNTYLIVTVEDSYAHIVEGAWDLQGYTDMLEREDIAYRIYEQDNVNAWTRAEFRCQYDHLVDGIVEQCEWETHNPRGCVLHAEMM